VLFAVPWHGKVIIGTTDTPVAEAALEPRALDEEIEFILTHAARYLTRDPKPADARSVYAGLRPLVKSSRERKTAALSRDHYLFISPSNLVTITGGKWTTYRKMGEDTVTQAAVIAGLPKRVSTTEHLQIHGWQPATDHNDPLRHYGSDAAGVRSLIAGDAALGGKLHPRLDCVRAQVVWAVRREMARTVEDVLSRRTRALLLDARASIEAAPAVAEIMAGELRHAVSWRQQQVSDYTKLARGYFLKG